MRQQVQVNQELADGTWHLKVQVEVPGRPNDQHQQLLTFRKRVRGDRDHVGGLIQKIVDSLNGDEKIPKQNWSEYELWWPVQRKWLLKHHWMLDKYSIQVLHRSKLDRVQPFTVKALPILNKIIGGYRIVIHKQKQSIEH